MRSLLLAICAAAVFAILASGARAETILGGFGDSPADVDLANVGMLVSH